MAKVNLPYGIDSFAKLRGSGCRYVDKTGLVKDLLGESFEVGLITRPRRFGKTLALSMLAEFLDIRADSRKLFEGLEIAQDRDLCGRWMNQRPVLFVTLKDVGGRTFDRAYGMLRQTISKLCIEHSYLETSPHASGADKRTFQRLEERVSDATDVESSLDTLIRMMKAHYGKEVVLLVDEYDVPLAKAGDNGYLDEMREVMRTFLGMAWRSNPNLEFAVASGCLPIADDSLLAGADRFVSIPAAGGGRRDRFGFDEAEVADLLRAAGLEGALAEMRKWYRGYFLAEARCIAHGMFSTI